MPRMPIFIIHPYKGAGNDYEENIVRVKIICRMILTLYPNTIPVSPVLTFNFLNDKDEKEREKALDCCAELLKNIKLCGGEAWVFGNHAYSDGCQREIALAKKIGMKLRYNLPPNLKPDRWPYTVKLLQKV